MVIKSFFSLLIRDQKDLLGNKCVGLSYKHNEVYLCSADGSGSLLNRPAKNNVKNLAESLS